MIETQEKDFYTTHELINQPWFPIRSTITLRKLIEKGKMEAINVSTNPKFKRYRILKNSALDFIKNQTSNIKTKLKK